MSDLPIPNVPEDITPQWLSAVLDACVSGVELSPIAGGNSSTTLRAAVRIESRADLPLSLIIKLPHTNPAIRSRVERDGYYAREVGFYRELAAKMGDNVSRCFYAAHDPTSGRSAIVIEDGAGPGVAVGDTVKGCSFEQAAEAMRTIAQMHAGFWESPGLERLTWLPAHSDLYQNLIQAMTDAWNRYPAHLLSQMSPALIETIELFCPRADQVVARTSGDPWTLTHGDYRLDNLLFGAQGKVIAFDWQICARAQGARDAAYFARELVDGHPIAETWQPLLDLYFTTLTESGVEYTERAFAQDVRVNTLQNMRGMVTLFVDRDFTIPRMRAASAASIERANWMAEHLDLPGLLRDEFPI